jgi:hypothetical protein
MSKDTLCKLVKDGFHKEHSKKYKALLKGAKYMCKRCGRAAADSDSLCKPAKL